MSVHQLYVHPYIECRHVCSDLLTIEIVLADVAPAVVPCANGMCARTVFQKMILPLLLPALIVINTIYDLVTKIHHFVQVVAHTIYCSQGQLRVSTMLSTNVFEVLLVS